MRFGRRRRDLRPDEPAAGVPEGRPQSGGRGAAAGGHDGDSPGGADRAARADPHPVIRTAV